MRSLSTIVALASVAALAAACSAAPPGELDGQQSQAVENDPMHIHWQKEARPGGGGGGGASNLVDHGGRVLASSNTYAIWWGSQRSFPADAEDGYERFILAVPGAPPSIRSAAEVPNLAVRSREIPAGSHAQR